MIKIKKEHIINDYEINSILQNKAKNPEKTNFLFKNYY